jgi:hypothetical protein
VITPQRLSRNEDGASLIIAMMFVSLVSVVTVTLLSFADSGTRATEALRQQGSGAYAADGAAKVAVNALRNSSTFMYGTASPASTTHCFGSADTLSLPAFPSGPSQSAVVSCAPKVESTPPASKMVDGTVNSSNTPDNSILTLGASSAEDGIGFGTTTAGNTLKVAGKVRSNSTINTGAGTLWSDTSISAKGACTPPNGLVAPTKTCSTGVGLSDPNYPPPTASTALQAVPSCSKNGGLVTFTPGLYRDSAGLNACDNNNTTLYFPSPGTYYFDFPATTPWEVDNAYVVGGRPQGWDPTSSSPGVPPIGRSCVSPLPSGGVTPPVNGGVQFVFGGASQWVVGNKAKAELCGSYSATTAPVAIYGLKSPVNGVNTVPAQSGCVTALGSSGCPFVSSTHHQDDTNSLYVQGTLYAPAALLGLTAVNQGNHQTNMYFNAGIIVRSLQVFVDGVMPNVVGLPGLTPVAVPQRWPESVAWLQVYVCANVSPCTTATGRLQLQAKVGISQPTDAATPITAGARNVKVYSWAVQR